jgi:hypothetical protein
MDDRNTITPGVRIGFAGYRVAVASDDASVIEALSDHFALMLAPESPSGSDATFTVRPFGTGFRVEGSGVVASTGPALETLLGFLEQQIRARFMEFQPALHWVHAGAVERRGGAIILPGATLRGKSTLVAALCAHGWRYLSDEAAPIDLDKGEVFPFPRTLGMRVSPKKWLDPGAAARLDKRQVRFSEPEVAPGPALLRAIVFPEYDGRSRAKLAPYPAGSALHELIRTSMNFRDHATTALRGLGDLVGRIPAYRLAFSDANEAAQVIDEGVAADLV